MLTTLSRTHLEEAAERLDRAHALVIRARYESAHSHKEALNRLEQQVNSARCEAIRLLNPEWAGNPTA